MLSYVFDVCIGKARYPLHQICANRRVYGELYSFLDIILRYVSKDYLAHEM